MNRADLQSLSKLRMREARILFNAKSFSGAYYLAGYAVECAVKACIAKSTKEFDFPDKDRVIKSYSHKIADLIKVAELSADFEKERHANSKFAAGWNVVNNWSEQSRYQIWSGAEAEAMIDAVERTQDGVLQWIMRYW